MTWKPAPGVEQAAVRLTSQLLACDGDQQCDILAVMVRLWCYHREQLRRTA